MIATLLDWLADLLGTDRGLLVRTLAQLVAILVVGWFANRLVRLVARRIELAVDDGDDATLSAEEKRGQTIAQLVRSVGRAVIVIGVVLSSLNLFVDIKPLLAGVGILSLAVSFGAQSLVKDFISGFFILFENQFVVGDVVQIGDKSGVVERMTLRVVMLRNVEGALHTIPNGSITAVTNMTRGWSRAVVDVSIGYQADIDRAIEVVRDELQRLRGESVWQGRFDGHSEVVGVQSLGDNGVVIRTLLRTQPGAQWEVAREFQRRIKRRLDDEGIEIPYPQRTVHVRHHQMPSDSTPGLDS
ncbi:MAG: mechanosensitive ion channel family protein [Gemmatimonadales bacterium]|nr:mechanosensitive ion channel family protein [Gemmatimonadales bacterium]